MNLKRRHTGFKLALLLVVAFESTACSARSKLFDSPLFFAANNAGVPCFSLRSDSSAVDEDLYLQAVVVYRLGEKAEEVWQLEALGPSTRNLRGARCVSYGEDLGVGTTVSLAAQPLVEAQMYSANIITATADGKGNLVSRNYQGRFCVTRVTSGDLVFKAPPEQQRGGDKSCGK